MAEAEARGSPQRPSAAGASLGLAFIPLCVSRVDCREPPVNVGYTGCGGSGEDGLESSQEEVPKPEGVQSSQEGRESGSEASGVRGWDPAEGKGARGVFWEGGGHRGNRRLTLFCVDFLSAAPEPQCTHVSDRVL